MKVVLVRTIGCLSEQRTRLVFAKGDTKTHRRDSGHIVKIRTRRAVNLKMKMKMKKINEKDEED